MRYSPMIAFVCVLCAVAAAFLLPPFSRPARPRISGDGASPDWFPDAERFTDYTFDLKTPEFGLMGRKEEVAQGILHWVSIEVPEENREHRLVYLEARKKPGLFKLDEWTSAGEIFSDFSIEGDQLKWLDRDTREVQRTTTCPILREL